ncbi:hypothetical protein [Paenibacillus kobensis]|uniref:hypothetical protein n=1 Tax=Paenibacillus kobensis TaxID=59841 RepID=UPI000FDB5D86|nr:hypothetical protein [Paenibacillus kobensis]
MYLRFHGNYSSPKTKQPYGIFVVIYHLYRDGILSENESQLYLDTKEWFEQNLPNPPYYDDNNSIHAVTWFKDEDESKEMLIRLQPFFRIAEKHKVEIIKSVSKVLPGILVYEDDYQVGIVNPNYDGER